MLWFTYAVNRRPTASQNGRRRRISPESRCSLRNLSRVTECCLPIFIWTNCIRPTHFLIDCILSENEFNNFMARLSHLLFKRITLKTNFQLLQYTMYYDIPIFIIVSILTVYGLPYLFLFGLEQCTVYPILRCSHTFGDCTMIA